MSTFSKILYEEAKKPGIEIVRYRLRRGEDIFCGQKDFMISPRYDILKTYHNNGHHTKQDLRLL